MRSLFKWIMRGVVCLIIIFLISGAIVWVIARGHEIPSVEKAPWAIQTYSPDLIKVPTRVYYVEALEIIDGVAVMSGFWYLKDGKYIYMDTDKPLPVAEYGEITILKRDIK